MCRQTKFDLEFQKKKKVDMFLLSAIVLIDLIGALVTGQSTDVINTTTGPVQGEIHTTVHSVPYAAFKGIRYAEAPVGYLRFKPPVPVDPWTETLNATVEGDECPQIDPTTYSYRGSEDCLFLNVFTPVTNLSQTPTELKSVMVWIYGGAFVMGSGSTKIDRPDFLLERDVVFVNFNYRLGALGFLSLDHPNATGNAGLKDQNLALKWVQANIEKFGGNPKNVTIFGESAGAASVGFHTISDASAGLFHGAISMSGTPLVPWGFVTRSEAVFRARRLCGILGSFSLSKARLLKTLYAATPEKLVNAAFLVYPIVPFTPTLEDAEIATDVFISQCSIDKYNSGNFNKVPQILGFMEQETVVALSVLNVFSELVDMTIDVTDGIEDVISDVLPKLKEFTGFVNNVVGDVTDELLVSAVNITTDGLFKAQIDQTQRILAAKSDNPVYYYDITYYNNRSRHNLKSNTSVDGAGHADDLAYIFYTPSANYNLDLSDSMGRTIYRVSTMWTNFAKYGNPTPDWVDEYPLNITWPNSGISGRALEIGNELKIVPRPISKVAEAIERSLRPTLSTINDCPIKFG